MTNIHRKPLDDLIAELEARDDYLGQALTRVARAVQAGVSEIEDQIETDRQSLLNIHAQRRDAEPQNASQIRRDTAEGTAWYRLEQLANDTRRVFTRCLADLAGRDLED